jgi:glyoxylase-like metal-dependent hydrolase (beta-lactamase superfamily II)
VTALPVADRWFTSEPAGDGVTRLWEPHVDDFLISNVWHVRGRDADLVVDTANGIGALAPEIAALARGRPVIAVATHGHFDHVGGLHEFEDRRVHEADADMTRSPFPLRMRRKDFPDGTEEMYAYYDVPVPEVIVHAIPEPAFDLDAWVAPGAEPTGLLRDGDVIDLGDRRFEVVHTPGHTDGSACLWDGATGSIFTGDAIYVDAPLDFTDTSAAGRSLERLVTLPVTSAYAGHERSFDGDELRALAATVIGDLRAGRYDEA